MSLSGISLDERRPAPPLPMERSDEDDSATEDGSLQSKDTPSSVDGPVRAAPGPVAASVDGNAASEDDEFGAGDRPISSE